MIRIGISLGKSPIRHDGLGVYSTQLCTRFASAAPELRERHGVELVLHVNEEHVGQFGDDVRYMVSNRRQRFLPWMGGSFALWHRLSHFDRLRPPLGAKRRAVTVHDLNYAYFLEGSSRERGEKRVRRALEQNDCFVTHSRFVRDDIHERFGAEHEVEVVHCGARSLVDAVPSESVEGLEGQRFLFHLSRMSPSKNIAAILDLAQAWPEMQFVLAGSDCEDTQKVAERLAALRLSNVHLRLEVTEAQKAWLYAHCCGFLFPSLTEGFGLPPIEAMHFGKPVFLSNLTSLPEVGGEVAHYFTAFDPETMRSEIEPAIEPSVAAARADTVRAHAATFNWDDAALGYLRLYGAWIGKDFSALTV